MKPVGLTGNVYGTVHLTPPLPEPDRSGLMSTRYERIVSVLREFPEVRNIRAIAEALDKELSR